MEEYRSNLVILIIFISLTCCSKESTDFIGSYCIVDASGEIKKKDSLIINANGTYLHLLYSIKEDCMIYENQGKWGYDNTYLILYDYKNDYFNSDCWCNINDVCYLPFNAYFNTNTIGEVQFLYQVVNILEGINYKRVSKD